MGSEGRELLRPHAEDRRLNADAVFLGGLIDENGAQVIKDKVAVLGPERR